MSAENIKMFIAIGRMTYGELTDFERQAGKIFPRGELGAWSSHNIMPESEEGWNKVFRWMHKQAGWNQVTPSLSFNLSPPPSAPARPWLTPEVKAGLALAFLTEQMEHIALSKPYDVYAYLKTLRDLLR